MSYMALYRKYRPLVFSDVVGQDIIVKILKNAVINNKIGHAYLFSGPRGTGKTSVAKIFAKTVNCLTTVDGDACGKCEICKKINTNSIDIIEIDAASNNGVDEIREIRNNVKLTPSVSKYKIYIIDEVHMLSTGAFNALLKTLEEPPKHVIFILATTEVNKIPLTIISRCQRFDFKKITNKSLKERLVSIAKTENKDIDEKVLNLIAKLSDGGLRDAINLMDQIITIGNEDITVDDVFALSGEVKDSFIEQLFDSVIDSDLSKGMELISELHQLGKNFTTITDKLLIFLRDITINNNINGYFDDEYSEKLNKYNTISNEICKKISKNLTDLFTELKKSTNQKIIFEIYFINLCTINQNLDIINPTIQTTLQKVKGKDIKSVVQETETEDNFKKIRVNNTLALASKETLKEVKSSYDEIENFVSNKTYNNIAKILLEGKVIAASTNHILISFPNSFSIDLFYFNLKKIESLILKIYKKEYKLVGVHEKEWNEIRKKYIENKKNGITYSLIEETKEILYNQNINDLNEVEASAIKIFGEEKVNVK